MRIALYAAFATVAFGCNKTASEPPPSESNAAPAASSDGSLPVKDASKQADTGGGSLGSRPVDWTLDTAEPARDYLGRYLRATLRYGTDTACVQLGRISSDSDGSIVEVRNPTDGTCGKANELRDTFLVNVTHDRMKLKDAEHRPALRPWPDGSLPDAPPNAITEIPDLHKWQTPLREVVKKQQLYPLRIQLYGRGTYPVVTLAGWHGGFDPKQDASQLKQAAKDMCAANAGSPLAFLAGLDRNIILRMDCPENPHWESL